MRKCRSGIAGAYPETQARPGTPQLRGGIYGCHNPWERWTA